MGGAMAGSEERFLNDPTTVRTSGPRQRGDDRVAAWSWLAVLVVLVVLASLDLWHEAQLALAAAVLLLMAVLHKFVPVGFPRSEAASFARVLLIALGLFLTLRYLSWRTTHTLSYHDLPSFIAMLTLYLAEVYGITLLLLGNVVNSRPLARQAVALPADRTAWPAVDVFVPTYDEEVGLVRTTLLAATQIRYPTDKLNVFLLDDGGTDAKCGQADPALADAARRRAQTLQDLCAEIGVIYLTRPDNAHAKAGNINAALRHSTGDLVLFLDADHVPAVDILEHTAGYFLDDPRLFLVQTPHFFINPSPIEKNLDTLANLPGENELFYSVTQRGLDLWNASFFCGSAAIMRRSHLQEIGGVATDTVTEDAETSLLLHSRGYRSAYVWRPLIAGLQPVSFRAFVRQRVRWAQGMIQVLLLHNPLRMPGLSPAQRLSYLNSTLFWLFGFARIVFLLAPSAYLLFGLRVYDATLQEFLLFTVPHLVAGLIVADTLFGRVRWMFFSELYELTQSLFSAPAVARVFRNPHAPTFKVTPKTETLETDSVSSLAWPFYILLAVVIASLAAGVLRYRYAVGDMDAVVITMGWSLLNLILVLAALGVLLERRQRRSSPRVDVDLPASLVVDGEALLCRITDFSVSGAGARVQLDPGDRVIEAERAVLRVRTPLLDQAAVLQVRVMGATAVEPRDKKLVTLGLRFEPTSLTERRQIVLLLHGDSDRWRSLMLRRSKPPGILRGTGLLIRTAVRHSLRHAVTGLMQGLRAAGRVLHRGPAEVAQMARTTAPRGDVAASEIRQPAPATLGGRLDSAPR
jgi:cellulose synthase (UDP-forming)